MTTPPLGPTRLRMSSGTLRGTASSAFADECEKITGASATRSASSIVSGDTWERSTSIPSRFISRTTSSPNFVRPPCLPGSGRAVRPVQGDVVGERHVADAEVVVRAQRAQRVLDGVAALEAEGGSDASRAQRALHVVRGEAPGQLGVARDRPGARCRSARAGGARSPRTSTPRACRPTRTGRPRGPP